MGRAHRRAPIGQHERTAFAIGPAKPSRLVEALGKPVMLARDQVRVVGSQLARDPQGLSDRLPSVPLVRWLGVTYSSARWASCARLHSDGCARITATPTAAPVSGARASRTVTWSHSTSSLSRTSSWSGGGAGSSYSRLKSCSICAAAASPSPAVLPVTVSAMLDSLPWRTSEVAARRGLHGQRPRRRRSPRRPAGNLGPLTTVVGRNDINSFDVSSYFRR